MRTVAVVVLCVDAFLLAASEMAWLSWRIGTAAVPVAALVALITTPLLVYAAAGVGRSGFPVLVVWAVTVAGAGLWSPTGVGVMPQDWRAILLIAAGALPGMWAAAHRPAPIPPDDVPAEP